MQPHGFFFISFARKHSNYNWSYASTGHSNYYVFGVLVDINSVRFELDGGKAIPNCKNSIGATSLLADGQCEMWFRKVLLTISELYSIPNWKSLGRCWSERFLFAKMIFLILQHETLEFYFFCLCSPPHNFFFCSPSSLYLFTYIDMEYESTMTSNFEIIFVFSMIHFRCI